MSKKRKCCIAIALGLAIKKKEKEKKKKIWMKDWLTKREEFTHENLLKELRLCSANDFRNYLLMDEDAYNDLKNLIGPKIKKIDTQMRKAISVNERLSITLRFLATGKTFSDLKFICAISRQSIGEIVIETCEAIVQALKDYIQMPKTQDKWKSIAEEFYLRWNFPNCLGALDGKHISIKKPPHSGSQFYNYKHFFSIILMAVVNANYEFLMVDVGVNGKVSDEGVLSNTNFGRLLAENGLNLPERSALPLSHKKLPFVFLGNDAFELTDYLMKPYAYASLTEEQRIFNYRLSRARRLIENTFGILVSRFGVLQRMIGLSPEKSQTIVLACCYLHNYLRKNASPEYIPANAVDRENIQDGSVFEGSWREFDIVPLQHSQSQNSTDSAKDIRDEFCNYFSNEGKVSWQQKFIREKNIV